MKRRQWLTALALALPATRIVSARADDFPAAGIGKASPAFVALDSAGRRIESCQFAGRILVLEWTSSYCPFADKHYRAGNVQALQRRTREAGGAWFAVISSPPDSVGHVSELEVELLTEQRGSQAQATLLDPTTGLAQLFGARATPHLFIVDRAGVLVYGGGMDSIASTAVGDIEKAIPYAKLALDATINGQPVPYPSTRPYGCAVKYVSH